jgi:hypothetical protein
LSLTWFNQTCKSEVQSNNVYNNLKNIVVLHHHFVCFFLQQKSGIENHSAVLVLIVRQKLSFYEILSKFFKMLSVYLFCGLQIGQVRPWKIGCFRISRDTPVYFTILRVSSKRKTFNRKP